MYPCFETFDMLVVLDALSRLQYAHRAGWTVYVSTNEVKFVCLEKLEAFVVMSYNITGVIQGEMRRARG
jgi:hypothetical protein